MKYFNSRALMTALVMALVSPFALADREDDRDAIHELMWRYARALDTLDADAYVTVFTDDGQFGSNNTGATKGHEALRAMVEGLKEGREDRAAAGEEVPAMYHMTTDSWIEFIDDTHARHHSYWMTVFAATESAPVNVAAAGRGVDELVKVNGRWLIQNRDVAPQD